MKTEFDKWKVSPSNKGNSYFKILGTSLGYKYRIAEVPFLSREEAKSDIVFDRFKKEAQQHAHLIAAAPLLLEKLIQLADRYKSLVDSGDCGFWEAEDEPEYIEAINVINKALGL